jgi:hypothetical protein
MTCRNCAAALAEGQRFCGQCAQRADVDRLTLHEIRHELVHAFTHADHSILALVRGLAGRPGFVAREYVDGHRKRHFGPFVFLVLMTGLATALIIATAMEWFSSLPDQSAGGFLQRHVNLVILLQVPILAGFCRMFFASEKLYYAEHLILAAYTSGFRILVLGIVAVPLWKVLQGFIPAQAMLWSYYSLWLLYFSWAASQFYLGGRVASALRALAAGLLTQAMAVAAVGGFAWAWMALA